MADTLEIFGTEYTGVTGLVATDDNGNDLVYTRDGGSDTFNVTLTQDSNENWIPDCTHAEAEAAYNNGKTLTFTAGYPAAYASFDNYDEFGGTIAYFVVEYFLIGFNDNGLNKKNYIWYYNDDIDLDLSDTYHSTSNANAQPADVAQDKIFYNANGYQVGTATGGTPTLQTKTKTYTPTTSQQTESVTADSGYDGLDAVNVTVNAMPTGTAGTPTATKVVDTNDASALITPSVTNTTGYITGGTKTGASFYVTARELVSGNTVTCDDAGNWDVATEETIVVPSGTAGTPTATKGTVSNHQVSVTPSVTNTTGYITGSTKTGTAVTVSASELVSGTYTVDSSGTKNVTNYASASVPSGTAGTPSASKGAVSNHSVSVTPSVTNTTGWITGSTKTGTAVTVSASELVSGTLSISDNGTSDCTNYASVNVNIPFVTYYTGTSTPASSLGSNGDIYLKVVS